LCDTCDIKCHTCKGGRQLCTSCAGNRIFMSAAATAAAANGIGSDCVCPFKGIDRTSIGEYDCSTCVMALI
jgi:hypothetical protein